MNEHEKRLGAFIAERVYSADAEREYNGLLDAALSAARDAALEEARADLVKRAEAAEEFGHMKTGEVWRNAAAAVSAMKPRPAERYIPEAKVREVLVECLYRPGTLDSERHANGRVREVARRLGVDLDAAPAKDN